jgi:hypothetical protein
VCCARDWPRPQCDPGLRVVSNTFRLHFHVPPHAADETKDDVRGAARARIFLLFALLISVFSIGGGAFVSAVPGQLSRRRRPSPDIIAKSACGGVVRALDSTPSQL